MIIIIIIICKSLWTEQEDLSDESEMSIDEAESSYVHADEVSSLEVRAPLHESQVDDSNMFELEDGSDDGDNLDDLDILYDVDSFSSPEGTIIQKYNAYLVTGFYLFLKCSFCEMFALFLSIFSLYEAIWVQIVH